MTLASWPIRIVRPAIEALPFVWAFFVPFIVIDFIVVERDPTDNRYPLFLIPFQLSDVPG